MSNVGLPTRLGIAVQLCTIAALVFLAVSALAIAAVQLADVTKNAARHIYGDVILNIASAAQLEVLLEKQRRLVESAPAELDQKQLQKDRQTIAQLQVSFTKLISGSHTKFPASIATSISTLSESGERVLSLAENFALDKAMAAAKEYATIANAVEHEFFLYRSQQAREAENWVLVLFATASSLDRWLLGSLLATLIVLGPVGATVIVRMLTRLARVKTAMLQLANNNTTIEVPSTTDLDEIGDIARTVAVFRSNAISLFEHRVQMERLNQQFDVALKHMSQGLCMFDGEQRVVICNERYLTMYGLTTEQVKPGTTLRQIAEYRIANGIYGEGSAEAYIKERSAPVTAASDKVQQLSDGRSISISRRPMPGGGWVTTHEDITEQRRAAERIAYMAKHDALTGLANRVLLQEELDGALAGVRRGDCLAVLCLDLDRFKAVNDTLGHPVGDAVLQAVADRLRSSVREVDVIARLGGDEFAVIQTGIERPEQAAALAGRLIDAIRAPYEIGANKIEIGTSIGIALAPDDSTEADELLKRADMALYRAKAEERGTFCLYEAAMEERLIARRTLEHELRQVLVNGSLELHYQPILDLQTGTVGGLEALLRWCHPERGFIPPLEFISIAEEIGLIGPIGEWVMREACIEAAKWPDGVKLAVNLSPVQFKGGKVALQVVGALAASGMDARRLVLEITESTLLEDNEANLAALHQLRGLGVRIALDDFGTGYSSLNYLRCFPFDEIKIDRSFIHDASSRSDCVAIVHAIANLAASLNMETVAEGVETEAHLAMVRASGCTKAQGYLFSPAVPAQQIATVLMGCAERMRRAA